VVERVWDSPAARVFSHGVVVVVLGLERVEAARLEGVEAARLGGVFLQQSTVDMCPNT